MSTFSELPLSAALQQRLTAAQFTTLTPVQEQAKQKAHVRQSLAGLRTAAVFDLPDRHDRKDDPDHRDDQQQPAEEGKGAGETEEDGSDGGVVDSDVSDIGDPGRGGHFVKLGNGVGGLGAGVIGFARRFKFRH